ncbi:podoplanin [Echeneis naucrates]|uniref:podoplanin n=1 Tax=Echeneis naucrates TaxID=173247 RepID=UPI00111366A8|nr:podoplanin-like [Echeneis naucrates]
MMAVQLLLLLALVGPLCALPTSSPTQISHNSLLTTADVTTLGSRMVHRPSDEPIHSTVPDIKSAVVTDSVSTASLDLTTELTTIQKSVELHTSMAPKTKETPKLLTTVPLEPAHTTVQDPSVTTGEIETKDELIDNQGTDLTTGQIVGIIIGALLAVIIVAAVVIAAVRRMGKYSP